MIHRAGLILAAAAAGATLTIALASAGFAPGSPRTEATGAADASGTHAETVGATAAPAPPSEAAAPEPRVKIVYDNVYIPAAGTPQPADPPQAVAATRAPAAADEGPVVIVRVARGGEHEDGEDEGGESEGGDD